VRKNVTASRPGERNKGLFASASVCRTMIKSNALWSIRTLVPPMQRIERPLRLTSGLVLFAYATSHLVNHAFGIRSIEAMEAAGLILHKPWTTLAGLFVLYISFFIHGFLGLFALYRRRHLRMPTGEILQLAFGLAIPVLLIPHASPIRIGETAYGLEFGYGRVIYQYWVFSTYGSLLRQYALLLVMWIHGCIGLRTWLAPKQWYQRNSVALASLALLVPVLALLGFSNAGLDALEAVRLNPESAAAYVIAEPGAHAAEDLATVRRLGDVLVLIYLGLVAGTIGLRMLRDWHVGRFGSVRITYPGARVVMVAPGFSVLEASRWAGFPHESVCGGRGRCSTCRVRVINGATHLAPPGPDERRTLDRIGNPIGVRLACQIRPQADIVVEPLVRARAYAPSSVLRFPAAIEGGTEMEIAALFVDVRESTRLATGRLPYDILFLFDRYIQVVTVAIRDNGGHVTSIAGDGVMSMFGVNSNGARAARDAFRAASQLWEGIEALSRDLADEFQVPLRAGIGLHVGTAVVGVISAGETGSLQFLGDTGNLAAKLEAETKRFDCVLIASAQAAVLVAPGEENCATFSLSVPGKEENVQVIMFRTRDELDRLLRPAVRN
jgi:adenylate cyclase